MPELSAQPLPIAIAVFLLAAGAICWAGTRLAQVADRLADRTGMGEVVAGALFVGASTSLPGAITSMTTAAEGFPSLAIGNALGGLTVQTAFLAVADLVYRRANLEHAAASPTGLAQGVLLLVLIAIPLIAANEPPVTTWEIHPASVLTPLAYLAGLRLLGRVRENPMWKPVQTARTRRELSEPDASDERSDRALWLRFALLAIVTATAGYAVGETSIALVAATGLSATAFGTIFTAIANSLPELVTAVAAVRIGAANLAVGDVIGGNAFEVLFISAADFVSPGSIYASFSPEDLTTALIAMLMTGVLLLGMIRRVELGFARIGFESATILLLYGGSVVLVFL